MPAHAQSDLPRCDAYVVGSGPNGLAAAIVLASAGVSVAVVEGAERPGGSARSAELTLPGFVHDICSSIHPLGIASPFFRTLPLEKYGLEWVHPDAPLAHPLDDGTAVMLERDLEATCAGLGEDADAYRRLIEPVVERWDDLIVDLLAPLLRVPRHPFRMAWFGMHALRPARSLARSRFRTERARVLFAGMAGHAMLPLSFLAGSAIPLVLAACGHTRGWPFPRGGTQKLTDALVGHLQTLGGTVITGRPIANLADLPPARAVLCDVTPRQLLAIAGDRLPNYYRRNLGRYRYGPGAFKVDWALDGPIPWTAGSCRRAATVHLGSPLDEIVASERAAWGGGSNQRPFIILAQHSLFDPTRAPAGKHTAWAYCHVPNGSSEDMLARMEDQIERHAPGFRRLVLARSVLPPLALEAHNPNLVGGDINAGAQTLRQVVLRPSPGLYATPAPGLYLCSASTPPGGGVHGMCGFNAARLVLRERF